MKAFVGGAGTCGVIFHYQPESAFGSLFRAMEVEPGASGSGHEHHQGTRGELPGHDRDPQPGRSERARRAQIRRSTTPRDTGDRGLVEQVSR